MFPVYKKNLINASYYYLSSSYGTMKMMKSKYLHFKKSLFYKTRRESLTLLVKVWGEKRCLLGAYSLH